MTRNRLKIHAALFSAVLISVLWLLPLESYAYELTPTSITGSEGESISVLVTADSDDWVVPDNNWVGRCADEGVEDATWVLIWKFHWLDGTATFGDGPSDGDIYLTRNGGRANIKDIIFDCASGSTPPSGERSWAQYAVALSDDNQEDEDTETATLILHKVGISSITTIVGRTPITIYGDIPYSDWDISVSSVTPTEIYPDDTVRITAKGDRTINPNFSYDDGWAFSFLLSDDADITLDDTVIESRSFNEYTDSFSESRIDTLNVQPGTYWVGACSTQVDGDPSNDCSEGVELTVLVDSRSPDLVVESVGASAETLANGEELEVRSDIRNVGGLTADVSTVRVFLSTDDMMSQDDVLLGIAETPVLETRMFWQLDETYQINSDAGEYYLLVCVDAVAGESALSNNCGVGPLITITGDAGDGCSELPLACDNAISGNLGAEDCTAGPRGMNHYSEKFSYSGSTGDRLFLNANWFGSLDGYLYIEGPDGLTVAQNDNFTGKSNSRIEYELKQDGMFTIWATSFDSAEQGNFDLSLACDNPSGPDLVLDAPTVVEGAFQPGQSLIVNTRLRNVGNSPSDSSRLRYVLSSNPVIDASDTELGFQVSNRLSAGSSRLASLELIAPSTPGTYYLGVCVDAVYDEASLSNNCSAATQIAVSPKSECNSRSISCGEFVTGVLSSMDCSSGPRGNGFLAEVMNFDITGRREFAVSAEWNNFDGYLVLTDPSGAIVAENDDSESGSRLEFKAEQTGVHQLWVTSFGRNETGSFGIDLRCGSSVAPDLSVSQATLNVDDVSTGESFTVTGTVQNAGNVPSDQTIAHIMLSRDGKVTTADDSLIAIQLPSLDPGESRLVQLTLQAPATPGNYWLGICVEPNSGETLRNNNCSVSGSTQSGPTVQLAGDQAMTDSAAAGNGALLTVTAGRDCSSSTLLCGGSTFGSLSAADCDASPRGPGFLSDPLTFSASQGDTITVTAQWAGVDGYLYLTDPVGGVVSQSDDSLSPDHSGMELVLERSGTYTLWSTSFSGADTGSYEVQLECNNPQSPDLAVDKPELNVTSLRSGQSLNIRTVARNNGGFASQATTMDFILANGPELESGHRILRTNDVPAMTGGGTSIEATDVAIHAVPGTYFIGACVNLDQQEIAVDNNCAVAGPIAIEDTGEPIAINSGLNDAWYNPETSGQGFFINIFPDGNQAFLSWFTFDTARPPANVSYQLGDPGHRWLTAQGSYDLGVAKLNVFLTENGVFDADQPAATTNPAPYGTMSLSFSDCNNGLIEYDLPEVGQSGSIAITRVSSENIGACEANLGTPTSRTGANQSQSNGFHYNASLNEAWFDPSTNGQGFFFNIFPDSDFVFLSWFTYDVSRPDPGTPYDLGEPGHRWLTAQGPFIGDTSSLKVYQTSGGIFNSGSLPAANTMEIGTMTASFKDCNAGLISYDIDSIGRANDIPIRRLAPDTIPACEAQSSAEGSSSDPFGNSTGATAGVTPSGKATLENRCDGSTDWAFDWPDFEGASYYQFELYRNDSTDGSPRLASVAADSEFSYSGKETVVDEVHLENWRWRYRPVMSFDQEAGMPWSKDFTFNVKPSADPCVD